MTCPVCGTVIVNAPNLFGKVVTFHQIPSPNYEGFVSYVEEECVY